ncbi:hypothetical protein B0A55_00648 [Friedmanniomyces simplex]|uniref:Rhodopsin domain-containing protein n=1 Tax=Friedmanniomyces simplex TaxID=329884 RepID=A0A4U0Y4R5_9PEZI|nr:hypothetical protein B0A55_00648 [Friedmanniomyces simplex]
MQNWPTLLYSHWTTAFSAVIILTRLCGRKVRSGALFAEDYVMLLAMIPLFIRMGLIHMVLIYGTNNINTTGHPLSATELERHSRGARLVLVARIFYAMFIWMSKLTVSEFLKRITIRIWRPSYEWTLQGIRIFLGLTFVAVVVATLTECQPFDHYWQVVPDPGPQCRSGYAQLITMATCDMVTDILLIGFPIPIVLRSGQTWKRKLQLSSLFSLSIIMVAVTATRMPMVIRHRGRQQYRTVWASSEILASTAVSNAVILGSFLRDKGTKKNKFRSQSVSDSIERSSIRRPTMAALQRVGSDEDLFRFLGCRVPDHLLDEELDTGPRVAPAAPSAMEMKRRDSRRPSEGLRVVTEPAESASDAARPSSPQRARSSEEISPAQSTKRSVSFFDVGGLLEDGAPSWDTRSRATTLVDIGVSGTTAQDFAPHTPEQSRRGSRAFLTDIGGMMSPVGRQGGGSPFARRHSDAQQSLQRHRGAPIGVLGPMLERQETVQSLQDPGGLLGDMSEEEEQQVQSSAGDLRKMWPESGKPRDQQHIQGVDGMTDDHRPGTHATIAPRPATTAAGKTPQTAQPTSAQQPGPDDMSLHDPGGLLGDS